MDGMSKTNSRIGVRGKVNTIYLMFTVITIGYLFALVPRFGLAINSDQISKAFSLNPSDLGILAAVYFYPYALMQIPSGLLADTILPETLIGISLLMISIGNLLFAVTPYYALAVVSRFITGFGGSLIYVPALRYTATYFPAHKFSIFGGILIAMNSLAVILVNGPLAYVSEAYGWRSIFIIAAVANLIIVVMLTLLKRGNSAGRTDRNELREKIKNLGRMGKVVIKNKVAWPMFSRSFLTYGVFVSFQSLWAGPYMMTFLGMNRIAAGKVLVLMSFGMLITSPIGGYLSDNVFKNRRKFALINLIITSICWIPLIVMGRSMTPQLLTINLFIMSFFNGLGASAQTTQVKEVYPAAMAGTALGFNNVFTTGGGAVIPMVFGFIIGTEFINPALQFRNAFLLNGLIMATAVIASFLSVETYKRPEGVSLEKEIKNEIS